MNITKNAVIAGLPGKEARDYMRQLVRSMMYMDRGMLANSLPNPGSSKKNKQVLSNLAQEGFLLFDATKETYRISDRGVQLAGARIGARITHARAIALVETVIARAKAINANPDLLLSVHSIHVFGSTIKPGYTDHGDVDMGFTVVRTGEVSLRNGDSNRYTAEHEDLVRAFCDKYDISRQGFCGYYENIYHLQSRWVKRELKCRSPYLGIEDFGSMGMEHITGPKNLVFFNRRDLDGKNYVQCTAANEQEIMHGGMEKFLRDLNPDYEVEALYSRMTKGELDAHLAARTSSATEISDTSIAASSGNAIPDNGY